MGAFSDASRVGLRELRAEVGVFVRLLASLFR